MKKVYSVTDLDCANCAAKMECAIRKLDGVQNASVSFGAQKIVVEADESALPEIEKEKIGRASCRERV